MLLARYLSVQSVREMRHAIAPFTLWMPFMPIGLLVLVAIALTQIPPPKVETFWPLSAVTYLTTISQVLLIIAWFRQSRKDDKAPIYEKLDQQTGELKAIVARVENDFAHEIAIAKREIDKDLNGLGGKINDLDREVGVALKADIDMGMRVANSERDNIELRKDVEQLRVEFIELRKEIVREGRASRRTARIARAQILAAIATMKSPPQQNNPL